jgi:hypothetical protein
MLISTAGFGRQGTFSYSKFRKVLMKIGSASCALAFLLLTNIIEAAPYVTHLPAKDPKLFFGG